ncbi:MAG: hypothetical protein K2L51_07635, partial [Clostridiales bacterium]|nr:hypothetical protein [Clostridiales bacterium]
AYELFSYDTGKKAYTYKMTRDNNHLAFAVKFVGGKLAVVERETTDDDGKSLMSVLFYDYGATSVTLPQADDNPDGGNNDNETGDDNEPGDDGNDAATGSEVTKAQWQAALGKDAYRNVTLQTDCYERSTTTVLYSSCMQFDLPNERIKISASDGYELLIGKYQGKYCKLEKSGLLPSWKEISQAQFEEEIDSTLSELAVLADKYDAFTYNAEKGVYTAVKITIDESVCRDFEIAFEDGKCTRWQFIDEDNDVNIAEFTDRGVTSIPFFPNESSGDSGNTGNNPDDKAPEETPDSDNKDDNKDDNKGDSTDSGGDIKTETVAPEESDAPETNPDEK